MGNFRIIQLVCCLVSVQQTWTTLQLSHTVNMCLERLGDIYNGSDVWMSDFLAQIRRNNVLVCSAVVIHKRWAVSAASCFTAGGLGLREQDSFAIYVNVQKVSRIADLKFHPDYNQSVDAFNVVLLKTDVEMKHLKHILLPLAKFVMKSNAPCSVIHLKDEHQVNRTQTKRLFSNNLCGSHVSVLGSDMMPMEPTLFCATLVSGRRVLPGSALVCLPHHLHVQGVVVHSYHSDLLASDHMHVILDVGHPLITRWLRLAILEFDFGAIYGLQSNTAAPLLHPTFVFFCIVHYSTA